MRDFVRVKHPLFGHFSTRTPEVWDGAEVVEGEPAVDTDGRALPAKPKVSAANQTAASKKPTSGGESTANPERGSK